MRPLIRLDGINSTRIIKVQLVNLLAKSRPRLILHGLLDQVCSKILRQDLWEASDVVDMFFWIERRKLPTQDIQRVDKFDRHAAQAGVERGKQAGWAGADDCKIN